MLFFCTSGIGSGSVSRGLCQVDCRAQSKLWGSFGDSAYVAEFMRAGLLLGEDFRNVGDGKRWAENDEMPVVL